MSSRKRPVVLSPAARIDFTEILLYTQEQWGEEQRDRYAAILERAIAGIADYPETGVHAPRLFIGCRVRRVERHVLYYRILDETIEVVRILHQRTDPIRHLRR
jgi:toxin ParE1/3/4